MESSAILFRTIFRTQHFNNLCYYRKQNPKINPKNYKETVEKLILEVLERIKKSLKIDRDLIFI